ncbi:hypothetical protein [Spiroplasma endosymbiont of Aspidapion aeneum]|uniref:hypothetical protein n=1 Tax=Spiroplasma endosymbiont of Aspidapion aeneum TaxID=3066276 RepID=UPI00313C7AEB
MKQSNKRIKVSLSENDEYIDINLGDKLFNLKLLDPSEKNFEDFFSRLLNFIESVKDDITDESINVEYVINTEKKDINESIKNKFCELLQIEVDGIIKDIKKI